MLSTGTVAQQYPTDRDPHHKYKTQSIQWRVVYPFRPEPPTTPDAVK